MDSPHVSSTFAAPERLARSVSYLDPPPLPAAVVVVKDVGGLVSDYRDRTAAYRAEGREVRLHECRSACTLALSLPNVCVYPDSTLKFHQAYNDITKEVDLGVSDELWRSYPQAVRARLGTLTRQYKVLRGAELIALGVRDCNAQKILVARARPAPQPEKADGTMLAGLGGALTSFLGDAPATPVRTTSVPAPPASPRPETQSPPGPPPSLRATLEAPLPPPRPPLIGAPAPPPARTAPRLAQQAPPVPPYQRPIAGSYRILQPVFVELSKLL